MSICVVLYSRYIDVGISAWERLGDDEKAASSQVHATALQIARVEVGHDGGISHDE